MSAVVFYYRRSELTPRSKFTIRSDFSTGGSSGNACVRELFGHSLGARQKRKEGTRTPPTPLTPMSVTASIARLPAAAAACGAVLSGLIVVGVNRVHSET